MSTTFLIEALEVIPYSGHADRREFGPGLNVIVGDSGAGKSTLFELARFALGGDAQKTPVFEEDVREVVVSIVAGDRQLALSRATHAKPDVVRVFDRVTQEVEGSYRVTRHGKDTEVIGKKMLEWLGMPTDVPIPGSDPPSVLTFSDVWAFIHVTQPEIDRSIARHDANARTNRRLRAFEMLFGLVSPELLALNGLISEAKAQLREAKARHTTITSFLENGSVPPRSDLRQHASAALQRREHYTAELEHLHSESGVRNDRVTLLRGLLTIAQGDAADVEEEIDQLTRVQQDRTSRIDRLHREITRLERFQHANGALADVEFAVCPRCMQSIAERHVEEGACRLCLQPEPEPEAPRRRSGRSRQPSAPDDALPLVVPDRSSAQAEQLATQREETNRLLMLGERELHALRDRQESIIADIENLRAEIERLSEDAVTPRIDELTTVTRLLAEAESAERQAEESLRLWDGLDDVSAEVKSAEETKNQREQEKKDLEDSLQQSRDTLFADLSQMFTHYLRRFRAPNAREGHIDSQNYLPYIDGKRFDRISVGGGNRTVFIVAYWLTLLRASLQEETRLFPAFLVLDSPQKSLSSDGESSKSIYDALQTLADSSTPPGKPGRRVQLFVVDNQSPRGFRTDGELIHVTYEEPAIRTIPHPGPQDVRTLEGADPLNEN
ncbi:AAA family ATPase [Streptomonospora arabica]|uniref:AAA family ATPase n=1 Tax=Streptomonospora arabica TaxID=412417 RepID=A0ABV9SJP9_9ACTN